MNFIQFDEHQHINLDAITKVRQVPHSQGFQVTIHFGTDHITLLNDEAEAFLKLLNLPRLI